MSTKPFFIVKYTVLNKWDQRMIDLAFHVARWSKDPRAKVGAVVLGNDRRDVALGYNGPPPGLNDELIMAREDKNRFIRHAEVNALDNARFDPTGATLFTTRPLCVGCANTVVARGLSRVVCPEIDTGSSWYEELSFAFDNILWGNVRVDFWQSPS